VIRAASPGAQRPRQFAAQRNSNRTRSKPASRSGNRRCDHLTSTAFLVHGGPSGAAKLAWSPTLAFWTAMGFAVIAPNIRGSTGFGIDYEDADNRELRGDALHDIDTINQWARAQPWCDPNRLVIGGISYGGYMTLLALTHQPTLWHAGIDGSGMSNLKTMEQLEDQTTRAFDDTEFGALGKDDALLATWSPITAVDRLIAPVFVYQGVHDPITPQHEADQIVAALRSRHIPVEYMLIANEGHGVTRRENLIAYLARSYRFLADHLALPTGVRPPPPGAR
jgi:dipeptidyl aminopeptidase/acylaminoacyl peptidase